MTRRVVTIFGASGFIGRHVVRRFAADGWIVRAVERDPVAAGFLKTMGDPGQVIPLRADVTDPEAVKAAVTGAEAVVNLVGILFEKGARTFDSLHHRAAAAVAKAAADAGAAKFVQVSALGADKNSASSYARTKALGEDAVRAAFPGASVIRPSVVFGPDDNFFNRFARLARISPVLPVFTSDGLRLIHTENGFGVNWFGSGGPAFQPVYVGDVAESIFRAATVPALAGKTYELGGPRRYSLKAIMELVLSQTGRRRLLAPVPFCLARLQAAALKWLPTPPLTPDQVKLMQTDNVVRGGQPGLAELGIAPTTAEAVLPTYLHRYRA